MIAALILIALIVVGFVGWELLFTKGGQRSIAEQRHLEGNDEPPTTF